MTIPPLPYRINDRNHQIELITDRVNQLLALTDIPFAPRRINDYDLQVKILTDRVNRILREEQGGSIDNCYAFPGVLDHKMALGNMTEFNGAAKVSGIVHMTCIRTGAQQALFTRYNDSATDTNRQLFFGFTGSQQLLTVISVGGAAIAVATSTASRLTAGRTHKVAFVYDGTQAVANNRLRMYYALRDDGTLVYPAVTPDAISYTGSSMPTVLQSPATVPAFIGGDTTLIFPSYLGGFIHDVRIWTGTALTQAEIDAETLDTNVITPSHWWNMLGNSEDSGSAAPADATPSLLVVPAFYPR